SPVLLASRPPSTVGCSRALHPALPICRGIAPSRLLMPLAFASMIGGTCTLIGTSTNIAVSGALRHQGIAPIGFFELTPLGAVLRSEEHTSELQSRQNPVCRPVAQKNKP